MAEKQGRTALLEPYIRKAAKFEESTAVFGDGTATINPPTLRQNCMNQIILYGGNFNPPHQGHLALVKQAFENSGHDLNVVAAFVYVTGDQELAIKNRSKPGTRLYSWQQRYQIWREEARRLDWCWIYNEAEGGPSRMFRNAFFRCVEQDGFQVEFLWLFGPDHITTEWSPTYFPFDCKTIITSNVDRPVDFLTPMPGVLKRLPSYEPWEVVGGDPNPPALPERTWANVLSGALKSLKSPSGAEMPEAPREPTPQKTTVWVCKRTKSPDHTIRFIQCHDPMDQDISSTSIRQIVASASPGKLLENIQHVAMTPSLLNEFSAGKS
jgi:cytidyltransferase-like protein